MLFITKLIEAGCVKYSFFFTKLIEAGSVKYAFFNPFYQTD